MTEIHSVNQLWSGDWLPLAMMHLFLLGRGHRLGDLGQPAGLQAEEQKLR